MIDSDVILKRMAEALLIDYTNIYYVNAVTQEYVCYSIDPKSHTLQYELTGTDFFINMSKDAGTQVYKDDRSIFQSDLQDEHFLQKLKNGSIESIKYRLVINGVPVYHTLRLIHEVQDDDEYYILGVKNIEKDIRQAEKEKKLEKERGIYSQIAESLASNFDVIYYINIDTNNYMEFTFQNIYGISELAEKGTDFFSDAVKNAEVLVYSADLKKVQNVLQKDFLLSMLEKKKIFDYTYRLMINGEINHTRLTAARSRDRKHLIIGVENINEEIKKEKEYREALRHINKEARTDELTGVKNQYAYHELENILQKRIEKDPHLEFAFVLGDLNHLKQINDLFGHKTGDEYIRNSSRLICGIFSHSPVFRIGGDEFVAVLMNGDYQNRDELFQKLRLQIIENQKNATKPVIATGISVFQREKHRQVSEVFEAADRMMYENKRMLKRKDSVLSHLQDMKPVIPDDQKRRLDSLFEAFSHIAKTSEVYLCNMRYDYSRWSKDVVDAYGLPSQYLYTAGEVWEKYIHPDDLERYRRMIQKIFIEKQGSMEIDYRVRRPDGSFVNCFSQGIVIRNEKNEPSYFAGFFRGLL